jgi:hypothetical protein
MLAGQSEYVDGALWAAYNTLNQSAIMAEQLAQDSRGHDAVVWRFEERARLQRSCAHVLRGVLEGSDHTIPVEERDAGAALPVDEPARTQDQEQPGNAARSTH